MNPFEEFEESNTTTSTITQGIINVWVETTGRKSNTYVSGWVIDEDLLQEHLKTIKKKQGCNGTIKNMLVDGEKCRVLHLQGDHCDYLCNFIVGTGIDHDLIHIKGV